MVVCLILHVIGEDASEDYSIVETVDSMAETVHPRTDSALSDLGNTSAGSNYLTQVEVLVVGDVEEVGTLERNFDPEEQQVDLVDRSETKGEHDLD